MSTRDTPRTSFTTAGARAGLMTFLALAALPFLHASTAEADVATNRYDAIIRRAPFGRAPRQPTPEEIAAALARQAAPAAETAEKLADTIKLNALTSYRGVPAAGFIDTRERRSFLLLEGQTLGGFTLESVDFRRASARLSRNGVAEDIAMSFAAGQPTNLLTHPTHVLPTASPATTDAAAVSKTEATPAARGKPSTDIDSALTPEAIAAATVVDASGEARISFRELHRLRVQQMREKADQERRERDALSSAAKAEAEAAERKKADEAEAILVLEEKTRQQHRAQVIEAIKQGYDVAIDFELTPAEAKSLADAGFAIPEEALKAEPEATAPAAQETPKAEAPAMEIPEEP